MRIPRQQRIEHRQLRELHRIAVTFGICRVLVANAPPVADDEHERLHLIRVTRAARRALRKPGLDVGCGYFCSAFRLILMRWLCDALGSRCDGFSTPRDG